MPSLRETVVFSRVNQILSVFIQHKLKSLPKIRVWLDKSASQRLYASTGDGH